MSKNETLVHEEPKKGIGDLSLIQKINGHLLRNFHSMDSERYFQARVLMILHLSIIGFLPLAILISNNSPLLDQLMWGIIILSIASIVALQYGHVTLVSIGSFTGMGLLASAIPYSMPLYHNHDVYVLATSHIFIIIVSSLISQKRGYTHFTTIMGIVYILAEFFTRALPHSTERYLNANNYIICLLLVTLTGFITSSTMKRKQVLVNLVTERSADLEKSLKEKEILLNEIHHRVKNNLNVAISLLRMQMNQPGASADLAVALQDSINRLYSMALVHERLYAGKDFSAIEFKPYIMSILSSVLRSYEDQGVAFQVEVSDRLSIELDRAIPCALILNELVTNVFKHAYPGLNRGTARVLFVSAGENYELSVSDSGVGMPQDGIRNSASLGMRVVSLLTEQLGGTLAVETGSGTAITITFPQIAA